MPSFKELNENFSLADQMQTKEDGSIVLINVFTVDPADENELLAAWTHDAEFMRAQPGYISTQLHKAIGGSGTFVNYAVWESVECFRNAFTNPEFQKRIADYPASAIASPHLFKKLGVPGHCVA
ncbi:antibiotic biosynthesis monooxygenase family protein [Parasphingopyxis lamellibrachiae]|uniref:Quinol monooxygenase YgiN n=1 Tax=Parasphingopyxis lamellibrachiae TaxID=680125 RepID=A0A3D9FD86_9SPHN|nr:antibiotic biosynthesis monooxygenase family protein [Parasphingopyxis lamellibrachiae]RED15790.1 quinol monooxygenase YgiN [Parasphingopyxis lamellibrachiae]